MRPERLAVAGRLPGRLKGERRLGFDDRQRRAQLVRRIRRERELGEACLFDWTRHAPPDEQCAGEHDQQQQGRDQDLSEDERVARVGHLGQALGNRHPARADGRDERTSHEAHWRRADGGGGRTRLRRQLLRQVGRRIALVALTSRPSQPDHQRRVEAPSVAVTVQVAAYPAKGLLDRVRAALDRGELLSQAAVDVGHQAGMQDDQHRQRGE